MNQLQLLLTPEAVQKYIRIALQWISGAIVSYGLAKPDATWLPILVGSGTTVLTFAWTIYGGRVIARLRELSNIKNPDGSPIVIITDKETAKATPDQSNIVSKEEVKVVPK